LTDISKYVARSPEECEAPLPERLQLGMCALAQPRLYKGEVVHTYTVIKEDNTHEKKKVGNAHEYGAPLGTKPERVISAEIAVFAPIACVRASAKTGRRGESSPGEKKIFIF
jgi:hypothetical protein